MATATNFRSLNETRSRIHDYTGFDAGNQFESADEVRGYFTEDSMAWTFPDWYDDDDQPAVDADTLAQWAELVISERWHCDF